MQPFSYSERGLELTKRFEGCSLKAYHDSTGVWTIGYGHTAPNIISTTTITDAEAENLLRADLAGTVNCVNRAVNIRITQNQFDALVDFCFNAGRGSFLQSTLLRKVNIGDFEGAAAQFGLWVHAGGKAIAGLVRRRKAEAILFAAG